MRKALIVIFFAIIFILVVLGIFFIRMTGRAVVDFPGGDVRFSPGEPITYSFAKPGGLFERECRSYEIDRVVEAFDILSNLTEGRLEFANASYDALIKIKCYKAKANGLGYMLAGEGGYRAEAQKIVGAELKLYTHMNCGTWPDLELHEILHIFGFGHRDEKQSIMNPILVKCDLGKIDKDIIGKLNELYS